MSKMNDFKRVAFTTVSQPLTTTNLPAGITSDAASFRFGADFLAASQNKQSGSGSVIGGSNGDKKTAQRTIRLELELFKTDSSAYPEFNYKKLINLELKKLKKAKEKVNGFGDPFEDNDDDVQRIAREMEKKYANTYGGKSRGKKDDFCDIGMGYDESDSFIDNTEAYDEVVPAEVETIEGGFYINCGALEFKSLRPEKPPKTRTDDIIKMPERIRKRILSSTSGSDDSDSSDESDANDNDDDNSEDSDEDDDDEETSDESSIKTSKSKDSYLSNEKNGKHSNISNDKETKSIVLTTSSSSTSPKPIPSDNNSENETKSRFNTIKTTTVKDMLKAKRDKFLKARVVREPSGTANGQDKSSDNQSSSDDSSDSEEDSEESHDAGQQDKTNDKNKQTTSTAATPATSTSGTSKDKESEKLRSSDTKLPKLDEDVSLNIFQFKELVKSQNCVGKKFQFNDTLTEIFLKIDESLMCIDKPQRNMVFAHLEFQLMLPKYYFLRKAKQLRIKEEKSKVSRALMNLSSAVSETMSSAIVSYEVEFRKFTESQNAQLTNTEQQPMKMPRKKFPWNTNIRNLLFEVYQVRWTSYPVLGTRKETLEEFINGFLRSKVVELWPTGWMRYEEIQREIEKRKNAQKKAKERERLKKEGAANANIPANSNIIATAVISDSDSNLPTNGTGSEQQQQQQEKQIPTGSNLKRKNSDASVQKPSKNKAQKLSNAGSNKHNKQQKQQTTTPTTMLQQQLQMPTQNLPAPIDVVLDLCTPTNRTESNIMLATSNAMGIVTPTSAQSSPFPIALNSSPSVKPTLATHVIDLDNYTSTSDILKTTTQLAASRIPPATTAPRNSTKADTSDEDSCVEFVGIYPAQTKTITATGSTPSPNSYKQKTKSSKQANMQRAPNIGNSPLSSLQMEPPNFYSVKAPNTNNNCSEYGVAQMMKQMEEFKRNIQHQQLAKNAAAAAVAAAAQLSQLNAKSLRDTTNQ